MRKMNVLYRVVVLSVTLAFGILGSGNLYADETDLFTTSVVPNVLILFDNSGSMDTVIFHADYNDAVTYSGSCSSSGIYILSSTATRRPRDVCGGSATTPQVSLYGGPGSGGGGIRYDGNYLNWIFYNANATQRGSLP